MNSVCAVTQGIQEPCPPTLIEAKCGCYVEYDDHAKCSACNEAMCDECYLEGKGTCDPCFEKDNRRKGSNEN